jgi:hypothetical protein
MLKNTQLGLYALSFNAKMPKTFVESNNAQGRFSVEHAGCLKCFIRVVSSSH